MKRLVIFDMDGTILDSIPYWKRCSEQYLTNHGVIPPADFQEFTTKLTLQETARYIQKLGIDKSPQQIVDEILSIMRENYRLFIPALPGMVPLIQQLAAKPDHLLCILTSSERICVEQSMERLGLLSCFRDIFICDEMGLTKRTPDIFYKLCSYYGTSPEHTIVYEDSSYAIDSAKKAGCQIGEFPF